MANWRNIRRELLNKKVVGDEDETTHGLKRCLNVADLTALGVGSTLGVGVYVLVGFVALSVAGPSIVLSFLVAAVASMLAGLCYAELGARMPQAGSAYIYTYISAGEIYAFVVGWNMLLDYLFGTASIARGLSLYVDALTNKTVSGWLTAAVPLAGTYLGDYYDLLAFAVILVLGGVLGAGMKMSSLVNNVCASVNLLVILFVIIAGAFSASPQNWRIPASAVPAGRGAGGFFPYGVAGTMSGAAICFYGFVGFETICHISEEVKRPRRSVPVAIMLVLVIVLFVYCGVAVVLTMMLPYYELDKNASVAEAFKEVGLQWAQWIIAVGAIFGMVASIFGAMLPVSRLVCAMAADGLVFRSLASVSERTNTPVVATAVSTVTMAILAGLLDLQQILLMMSFGTLFSYSIVAAEVVMLRYKSKDMPETELGLVKRILGIGEKKPSKQSYRIVLILLALFSAMCTGAGAALRCGGGAAAVGALHAAAVLLLAAMCAHPQNDEPLHFKTPLVPIVPCISIYGNINLMVLISYQTWIRNAIWLAFGLIIYIICSIKYKKYNTGDEKIKIDKHGMKPTIVATVQIGVPDRMKPEMKENTDDVIENYSDFEGQAKQLNVISNPDKEKTEIVMLQAIVETNEEKEAKIIDLLDKVLQAEEESYGVDLSGLAEQNGDENISTAISDDHRQSTGDISDAESDASLGQVLSKYDVIAQVHREDMSRLSEEEEKQYSDGTEEQEIRVQFYQGSPEYDQNESESNISETNSRTDESGYSDTIYKSTVTESTEDTSAKENAPYIPTPPPLDESFFAKPAFRKSYSLNSKTPRMQIIEIEDETRPRKSIQSIQSNGSLDDGHIVFGSDKQANFMTKLNNLFQTKMLHEGEQPIGKSHSVSNVTEVKESINFERPAIFADLKKELLAKDVHHNLKPVQIEVVDTTIDGRYQDEGDTDTSLTRSDLKSKLETIFANGRPQLVKPRLRKSTSPMATPETEASSPESIPKLPKVEKNDTLKRQKDKFGQVLNSFRLSVNQNELV